MEYALLQSTVFVLMVNLCLSLNPYCNGICSATELIDIMCQQYFLS